MDKVKLTAGEWAVVCDGARALLLENAGDEKFPNLKTSETYDQKHLPTHLLGADAPGRSISSHDHRHSAVSQTDWHDQAEHAFLDDLAKRLDGMVTAGRIKSLVMVASPRALGMIRPAYSQRLRGAIRAEIAKDLVKLPVYEIEKHLTG